MRLIVEGDGTGVLISKETKGQGGYEPGAVIRDAAKKLSKEKVQSVRWRLEECGFWKLPTRQQLPERTGLDGAQWIVEACKGGHYQIVDRWSPPSGDPIQTFGMMFMVDLAHLRLRHRDVY